MREQTKKFMALVREYEDLKHELFGDCHFIEVDEGNAKQQRYNQLFMFFNPNFRTHAFKLEEMMI